MKTQYIGSSKDAILSFPCDLINDEMIEFFNKEIFIEKFKLDNFKLFINDQNEVDYYETKTFKYNDEIQLLSIDKSYIEDDHNVMKYHILFYFSKSVKNNLTEKFLETFHCYQEIKNTLDSIEKLLLNSPARGKLHASNLGLI